MKAIKFFFKVLGVIVPAVLIALLTAGAIARAGSLVGAPVFFISVALATAMKRWGIRPVINGVVIAFLTIFGLLSSAIFFALVLAGKYWRWLVGISGGVGAVIFMLSPSISSWAKVIAIFVLVGVAMYLFTMSGKWRSSYHGRRPRR